MAKNNRTKDTRNIALDIVRAFAILMVLVCHAVDCVYEPTYECLQGVSEASRLFAFVLYTFGRMGVPLFLFLTGYLTLDKKFNSTSDVLSFWKRKLLPMFVTYECWVLFYSWFLVWFHGKPFEPLVIIRRLLLMEDCYFHLWYMPMIMGIYLLLPFVAEAVGKFSVKALLLPVILSFAALFLFPSVNMFLSVGGKTLPVGDLSFVPNLAFSGGVYGLYVLLGHVAKKAVSSLSNGKIKGAVATFVSFVISVMSFGGIVYVQHYNFEHGKFYSLWYNSALQPIFAFSFVVFACLAFRKEGVFSPAWRRLSLMSLGIYLCHLVPVAVLTADNSWIMNRVTSNPARVGLTFIISFLTSWAFVEVIYRIPVVSSLLLMKKKKQ